MYKTDYQLYQEQLRRSVLMAFFSTRAKHTTLGTLYKAIGAQHSISTSTVIRILDMYGYAGKAGKAKASYSWSQLEKKRLQRLNKNK